MTEETPAPAILYHEEETPWWLPIIILAFPLIPSFRKYHVTLTDKDLAFGYAHSWTMKRIPRDQIESVEVVPEISGLWQWGGYGIRLRPVKPFPLYETAYLYKDGPGLRITIKGENGKTYHYTFNVKKPDDLKTLLETK